MYRKWHIPDIKALENELKTNLSEGLTIREARARLEREKRLSQGKRKSLFVPKRSSGISTFMSFLMTPGVILLLLISLLTMLFGNTITGLSVFIITSAGAVAGGIISHRSKQRLDMMSDYASPMVKVKRGGNIFYTDGRNAVVGDIIILSRGDLLPCDARLISSDYLEVKELMITKNGIKNRQVKKDHGKIYTSNDKTNSSDAENMLYAGTAVVSGKGMALVIETGSNVFLSQYLPDGALALKDGENENSSASLLKPTLYKICFLCASSLLILSLLSLITLREYSFINNFLMLLSSVAFISTELINVASEDILSRYILRMNKTAKSDKRRELSASVRNIKALDTLTGITDLIILGKAGLCDGIYHIGETYTASRVLQELMPDSSGSNRLLTYIHTYLKALKDSGYENDLTSSGVCDSLANHLKSCGFDLSGASLVIRSLYYTNDSISNCGYACAESTEGSYRTALTFDRDILSFCKNIREGDSVRALECYDLDKIEQFVKKCDISGSKSLFVICDSDKDAVLEGVISIRQHPVRDVEKTVSQLHKMGIKTTVMLTSSDSETLALIRELFSAPLFEGNILYADDVYKTGNTLSDIFDGGYSAYVGFSAKEYTDMLINMRKGGRKIAAYGVDQEFYTTMSFADIAISCDVMRYSSDKYKDSVYERMVPEGKDTNLRCTQMTRLLSRVTVRRSHERGGGIEAISHAIKLSRGAYISLAQAVLLFVMLMSTLLPIAFMSVLTGNLLLNAVQASALATSAAFIGLLAFSSSEQRTELIYEKKQYISYPSDIVKYKLPGIAARASVASVSAITVKILDVIGVFGEAPSYTMPMYIIILLTAFAELFIINRDYTKGGEGRRRGWLKMLFIYALMLGLCGVMTQNPFSSELFPKGIGTIEFLIVPVYIMLYASAVILARFIEKRRKTH